MIWCSDVTHKWKWKCSAITWSQESCLVYYTATPTHIRLWFSNRAPYLYIHNSCTVSTSLFQAAPLSWNQLHLRDVGDDSWRLKWANYTVFISIHCSIAFKTAYLLLGSFWGTLNACPATLSGNVHSISQINTIHSLSGISLSMAGCCTSRSGEWSRQTSCWLTVGEPSGAFCHLDHHGNSQIHNQHSHQLQLNILQSTCNSKLYILSYQAKKQKQK